MIHEILDLQNTVIKVKLNLRITTFRPKLFWFGIGRTTHIKLLCVSSSSHLLQSANICSFPATNPEAPSSQDATLSITRAHVNVQLHRWVGSTGPKHAAVHAVNVHLSRTRVLSNIIAVKVAEFKWNTCNSFTPQLNILV